MALSHAIMTALLDEELTGYDLTKQFEVSLGFFWKASHQQIYRTLRDLANAGLVTVKHHAQDGKPDKKLYKLTDAGATELANWVATSTPERPVRDELFVKLYNVGLGNDAAICANIRERLEEAEALLAIYGKIRRRNYAEPGRLEGRTLGIYLSLLAGIARAEADVAWCTDALDALHATRE